MAHIPHALSLPEVSLMVAQYLEFDDFTACSFVCKSFYAFFAPYLWKNVHLGVSSAAFGKLGSYYQEPRPRLISPDKGSFGLIQQNQQSSRQVEILQFVQKIAPWMRSLSLDTTFFTYRMTVGDQCTNLRSLLISFDSFMSPSDEKYWNDCEALVRQNATCLRALTLMQNSLHFSDPLRPIWTPLHTCAQHANLTTLRIQRGVLHAQDLEAFWTICRQLEILELAAIDMTALLVPSNGSSTETTEGAHHENRPRVRTTSAVVRFPKLHELTLDAIILMDRSQMEFMLQCPMLRTLFWRVREHMDSLDEFCGYFEAQKWPYLDSLEIICLHTHVYRDDRLRLLRATKRPFKHLDLHIDTMDQESFDLLREGGHFGTLTKVNLSISPMVLYIQEFNNDTAVAASKMIREILESCPSLEHIAGTVVTGQDIIDSKPWACHRLKKFEVMISLYLPEQSTPTECTKDEKRRCHLVFERLSQLRQLKVLNTKVPTLARYLMQALVTLPLDLRMGLGRLSTLTDLESVGYEGGQRMRVVDVEWMLQHWTKLRTIIGGRPIKKVSKRLGNANVRCDLIMKALKARKVRIATSWWTDDMDVSEDMGEHGMDIVYDTDDDSEGESE
ncbi:hypothetical protein B0O80DRAFT_534268 [Mortierella sp. GBAus27b]|nr:hypothetical protein B0O80DRAFT_534268 [Mortierella sp. GBAus27b]